jgi:hypothetical protein
VTDLMAVIKRLGDLMVEETQAFRSGTHGGLSDFNYRKAHCFLELNRAMAAVQSVAQPNPLLAELLRDLRAKIEVNKSVLEMHLDAVHEVASILAAAIRQSESDGTYSQSIGRTGAEPW